MAKRSADVTEAELAVLQVLWEDGPATVRRLVERLYPAGGPSASPTVLKLVERLEAKGCVARDRGGPVQTVRATVGRSELISRRLKGLADELGNGTLASLLSQLVKDEGLGPADRKALRDLVDGWDERGPGRKG
ncbi:Penicillinase repressor [Aquisphaera giovannonii]|uniref:Penicillinase repressor n=1 Tax=Aquisphaera giovannonii TaxID=406548 RepID=A0A5B9W763_9BACT|nr:BlaI/MecI/CopY family transcriptional regulator [Aquisphaera giovannonii]QEH36094.1 Penicillinase repressor [Aquisphaera giovannonii]